VPRDKDRKRIIRSRMKKTGESYTTARTHVISKADQKQPRARAVDYASLAGMSTETIAAKTGRTWQEWVRALDGDEAAGRPHRDIAALVHEKYGVGDWWAQSVTVGYERARGMRAMYQDAGGFSVSASKTIAVSAERISDAFTDADLRARWLPDAPIRERTSNRGKSARFDWDDPSSRVGYNLSPKGEGKTQLGLAHERLPDAETAERLKLMWRERLGGLKELLEAR
jgi:uncharacterized protein YndB with AHSA1/START domain